jgi:hypothetical protein
MNSVEELTVDRRTSFFFCLKSDALILLLAVGEVCQNLHNEKGGKKPTFAVLMDQSELEEL